jgi:hypothetical protein
MFAFVCTCARLPGLPHRRFRFTIERKNSIVPESHVGQGNVAHYCAYQIGPDGRIRSGADLDCADDEAAIEAAKQLVDECANLGDISA